jgi:hypothetical protein
MQIPLSIFCTSPEIEPKDRLITKSNSPIVNRNLLFIRVKVLDAIA